jgi:hypothetical protein
MKRCNEENVDELMKFVLDAPFDEEIVDMDCTDGCEQLARLAELAAQGHDIGALLPALEEHMAFWKDCREEFQALVAILRAEQAGALPQVNTESGGGSGED